MTTEVLAAYVKTWEKNSNVHASEELISSEIDMICQTSKVFLVPSLSFPEYLTGDPSTSQPCHGVTDFEQSIPSSLSINLANSQLKILPQALVPKGLPQSGPSLSEQTQQRSNSTAMLSLYILILIANWYPT